MEHNLQIDGKTGKMEWPKPRKTPDWTKIRQKTLDNIERKFVKDNTKQDTSKLTAHQ